MKNNQYLGTVAKEGECFTCASFILSDCQGRVEDTQCNQFQPLNDPMDE